MPSESNISLLSILLHLFDHESNILFLCCYFQNIVQYSQTSNICHTKSENLDVPPLALHIYLANPFKPGVESRMKMTDDAPTTSEWSTILLSAMVTYIRGLAVYPIEYAYGFVVLVSVCLYHHNKRIYYNIYQYSSGMFHWH